MFAGLAGHSETVRELHGLGADVNAVANDGMTAVMLAAQGGHSETVRELDGLGVNVKSVANH